MDRTTHSTEISDIDPGLLSLPDSTFEVVLFQGGGDQAIKQRTLLSRIEKTSRRVPSLPGHFATHLGSRHKWDKMGFQKHIPSAYHGYLRISDGSLVKWQRRDFCGAAVQAFGASVPEIKMTWPKPDHLSSLIWDFHPSQLSYNLRFRLPQHVLHPFSSLSRKKEHFWQGSLQVLSKFRFQ